MRRGVNTWAKSLKKSCEGLRPLAREVSQSEQPDECGTLYCDADILWDDHLKEKIEAEDWGIVITHIGGMSNSLRHYAKIPGLSEQGVQMALTLADQFERRLATVRRWDNETGY